MAEPSQLPAEHVESQNSVRGFWALIATQFQGAYSDNMLKWLTMFLAKDAGLPQDQRDLVVVLVVPLLFAVPFLLFSLTGGFLADRFSKRSVTVATKIMEIAVMAVAFAGLSSGLLGVACAAVFLISTQAALFGPSKYGLLPELLPEKKLSWGNGILELTTFVAIIVGTLCAALLYEFLHGRLGWSGVLLMSLSAIGLLASLGITRVSAANPARRFPWNPASELWGEIRDIRKDRVLWLAVVGNIYFWFLGSLLLINIFLYAEDVLRLGESQTGLLIAAMTLGIGIGSYAAGHLSGNKIEYGLIPLGSIGITLLAALLARPHLSFLTVGVHLAALGFFAGFFAVPINALIQHRPPPERKGAVIATANLLSFVGISLQPLVQFALLRIAHPNPSRMFLICAGLTLLATIYVCVLLPDALLRLVLWFATNTVYRIRVVGRDNIPEREGALLVCNHMSWVDALLLTASTDRPIRFLMLKDIYEHPAVYPFARIGRAIPISSQQRPRDMIRSLREASDAIRSGEVVCIFAEGQITRIGHLLPFRRGFERIMKGVEAPIVPVALDGVWGSIFSFERGRFLWKMPKQIPYHVTVSFGAPLPPTATAPEVRQAVEELSAEATTERLRSLPPLDAEIIRTARAHPFRFAMADGQRGSVRFHVALAGAILLARRLGPHWQNQKTVGILLPPSVPGALVNHAALLLGKVPVHLNYTMSSEGVASCARQCGLETVLTAQAFLDKVKLQVPGRMLLLEKITEGAGFAEKLIAAAMAWFLPRSLLFRALGRSGPSRLEDTATIIFSSGSTGEPKGVVLSHGNVVANIEQVTQSFALNSHDRLLGILPFFHSFGFTVTLMLPAVEGLGVVYHVSPLDSRAIGGLIEQYRVTFLLSTPTFLQAYMRRCTPEQFGSLAYVLVGAEKLPERVALGFEDTFGLRPLEGYGATECSPVVAVNAPDFRGPGFRQVGGKRGRIGHPLPGISVRIVDPESIERGETVPVPAGQPGMLLVRGPNVMQGYLNRPEKTAEALRNGWYVTGDVAMRDEDGFLTITDRLSRFSKIGGEMVPHGRVEEKLHELVGATEQTFVVAAVPDERKGERLVVLHTLPEEKLKECLEKLPGCGLPNLWTPRADNFFRVEALPYLGTGKLDLRRARELALGSVH
ncbi:MAG TPA: acyl-[ACP]--phospholipid O-acyltransferase [Candidatus Acidoferrales bacterium]|nr:acyl-[ACP]--phospholipid O-acyltransferase [Candidatus Acidoferrales bacterium]